MPARTQAQGSSRFCPFAHRQAAQEKPIFCEAVPVVSPADVAEELQKSRSKIKEKTFFFRKYKIILKKLLTNPALRDKIHHVPNGTYALVAQLDRVTDYESVGRGFESLPSHQKMP